MFPRYSRVTYLKIAGRRSQLGKLTLTGPVPPDDPMFLNGVELFSRLTSIESSMTSASIALGAIRPESHSAGEVEQDEVNAEALRHLQGER